MMSPRDRYRRIKVRSWNRAIRGPDQDGPWHTGALACAICNHRVACVYPAWGRLADFRARDCRECGCRAWVPAVEAEA